MDPDLAPSGLLEIHPGDADVELSGSSSGGEGSGSEEEDDEAELMAELARIKAERAAAAREAEAADREAAEAEEEAELEGGNPLLGQGGAGGGDATLKRRWDDDVVFRNQTRSEPKKQRRFVNDTVRSDFHRRFLNKYIQ